MNAGQLTWTNAAPIILMLLVILGLFWWIVVRPAHARQRRHQQLIDELQVGDKVVTVGGIYGIIKRVGEKIIEVDVGDMTLEMDRRAIRRKQSEEEL